MRSKAIAEAIQFLLSKITTLETANHQSIKTNNDCENILQKQSSTIAQMQSDNAKLQNEIKSYKAKSITSDKLIKAHESSIKDLSSKLSNQEKDFDNKSSQFSQIFQEYKKIFEEFKLEKLSLESQIAKLMKDNKDLVSIIDNLKKDKEKDRYIQKKLKDYELLLYKMDLENQTFKQEIISYQKKQGKDYTIQINKIDLNNELNTIDNDYVKSSIATAVNLCTETENDINDTRNNDFYESMSNIPEIDSIVNEIKKTEATLKEYSTMLIKKEKENERNDKGNTTSSSEFQEIMNVMEKQTEKLLQLKKKYNSIMKK